MREGETRTLIFERDLPFPRERVWQALTTPELLGEWLMESNFTPEVGRSFAFRAEWGEVGGRVLEVAAPERLAYTWEGQGLSTVVTWTLVATPGGTRLRLEQSGFRSGQARAYGGARNGWPRLLDDLEGVLAGSTG